VLTPTYGSSNAQINLSISFVSQFQFKKAFLMVCNLGKRIEFYSVDDYITHTYNDIDYHYRFNFFYDEREYEPEKMMDLLNKF
jgi:hypothetical protein